MAWPFGRLLDFIDDNPPAVDSEFLNEGLQDIWKDLFFPAAFTLRSIKALIVDGTGYAVAAALASGVVAKISGGALQVEGVGDAAALLTDTVPAVGDFKELWKINSGEDYFIRIFSAGSGLVITTNAGWSGTEWVYDDATQDALTWRFLQTGTLFSALYYTAADGWDDIDWLPKITVAASTGNTAVDGDFTGDLITATLGVIATAGNIISSIGYLQAGETVSSGTAGAGQGVIVGRVYEDTTCVAWAKVASTGTLTRGANISSTTKSGTGDYLVNLVNGVANDPVAFVTLTDTAGWYRVTYNSVSQIRVRTYVDEADPFATLADAPFSIVVFGG